MSSTLITTSQNDMGDAPRLPTHPTARISPSIESSAARHGIRGAILLLLGSLLSGPIGLVLVTVVHPAGSWKSAQGLADNYHAIQTVPFFFGLVLILGCDLIIAAAYSLAREEHKTRCLLAMIFSAAFTGLIAFNYICQTTFIPSLLTHYRPEYSTIIGTLSLVNPRSLSWAIEMWGWGLFGVATWLVAPIFRGSRVERATAWAFVLNGIISVAGAFITSIDLTWVMTAPGIVNYVIWNTLMMVLAALVIASLRRRQAI